MKMNKFFAILAMLLIFVSNNLIAQGSFYPKTTNETAMINEGIVFGIKGGVNCPRLYYTNSYLSDLPHDFVLGISGGVFVEIPFLNIFSVAPELNYQQRGGATSYVYEKVYNVNYKLQSGYASIRVPVYCYIPASKIFRPYLYLAPDVGYAFQGNISLAQPGLDIPQSDISISDANINRYYVGALGGVGFRVNVPMSRVTMVLKMDAAVNGGFLDTFSKREHQETVTATNVHAYNMQGKRFSRGLEISLSVGFIRNEADGCGNFGYYKQKQVKLSNHGF